MPTERIAPNFALAKGSNAVESAEPMHVVDQQGSPRTRLQLAEQRKEHSVKPNDNVIDFGVLDEVAHQPGHHESTQYLGLQIAGIYLTVFHVHFYGVTGNGSLIK